MEGSPQPHQIIQRLLAKAKRPDPTAQVRAAFEKHGNRRIDPKGEKCDHNFHQAIFEVENTGQPPGTIVEVLQSGYVLNDRLLRPAMVGVAKGGPAGPTERIHTLA